MRPPALLPARPALTLPRSQEADEHTQTLTSAQYTTYAEARQASFTYRKAKRFREFINLGAYLDAPPSDEVTDSLGFLASELVRVLVASGRSYSRLSLPPSNSTLPPSPPALTKRRAASPLTEPSSLFSLPVEEAVPSGLATPMEGAVEGETPLRVADVAAGLARAQLAKGALKAGGMRNWRGGVKRVKVSFF